VDLDGALLVAEIVGVQREAGRPPVLVGQPKLQGLRMPGLQPGRHGRVTGAAAGEGAQESVGTVQFDVITSVAGGVATDE
jgi:hypothetical protein